MLDKKTSKEIEILREGGQKLAAIRDELASSVKAGMTGLELDAMGERLITKAGGVPSFKGYNGFPNSICVSINEIVVHGIPTDKPFEEGDIVGIDLGMIYKEMYTDTAVTVPVGKVSAQVRKLTEATKQALQIGIDQVAPGKDIADIGRAIEKFIRPMGYSIVRDLAGHGVGRAVHEEPMVPNYDPHRDLYKMEEGLVIAIEPMIILGDSFKVKTAKNKWDVVSADGTPTAHFEHTVVVTKNGYEILT